MYILYFTIVKEKAITFKILTLTFKMAFGFKNKFFLFFNIYLAALGLSCSIQNL